MSVKIFCKKCKTKFVDSVTMESESNLLCPKCDPECKIEKRPEEIVEEEACEECGGMSSELSDDKHPDGLNICPECESDIDEENEVADL